MASTAAVVAPLYPEPAGHVGMCQSSLLTLLAAGKEEREHELLCPTPFQPPRKPSRRGSPRTRRTEHRRDEDEKVATHPVHRRSVRRSQPPVAAQPAAAPALRRPTSPRCRELAAR